MSKLNIQDLEKIEHLYFNDKLSTTQIGKLFNVNHNTIYRFLIRNGLTPRKLDQYVRKYDITDEYFECIDSFDKAYFLGLLYADGSLNLSNYSVTLSLNSKDHDILETFKRYTKFSGPVIRYESRHTSTISIYNKNFYNNTLKSGLYPNKSLTLKFPSDDILPEKFRSHFIRGYFDGDGCICIPSKGSPILSILGTEHILESINSIFSEFGTSNRKIHKKGSENVYYIATTRKSDLQKIKEFLYSDEADCLLIRKWEKFNML